MPQYDGFRRSVTSDSGLVVPNAQIEVFNAGQLTKPQLFADPDGDTALTNPFDADDAGFFEFYVAGGAYRIEAGAEGADGVWDWVAIGTAQRLDITDIVLPGQLHPVAFSGDHTELSNIGTNSHAQIDSHIASVANPHDVTKAQVGLGNVDNVSAADLRDRATHTGTQAIGTVSGLQLELDGKTDLTAFNSHVDNDDIHRTINDSGISSTDLWSADKISSEIGSVGVGAVSTGPSIDGDGSAGSPLDVADEAIGLSRLSPGVKMSLEDAYISVILNEDGAPNLAGAQNINPFDTAQIDTLFQNTTIDNGLISLQRSGVYNVAATFVIQATEITSGRVTLERLGIGEVIEVPFGVVGSETPIHACINASIRLSSADDLLFTVKCVSTADFQIIRATHASITRISGLDLS